MPWIFNELTQRAEFVPDEVPPEPQTGVSSLPSSGLGWITNQTQPIPTNIPPIAANPWGQSEFDYITGMTGWNPTATAGTKIQPDFDNLMLDDFTGVGGPAGRSMEKSFIPPPARPDYVSEDDFYKYGDTFEPTIQEKRKDEIKVKHFDWDGLIGSTAYDEWDVKRNIYKDVFDVNSLYTGQWKSFEDVLRDELGEEIPKSGVKGFNQKRNGLLKLRDWYNDRSENQRIDTENIWRREGLPVGDFRSQGRYEITQEDWEDSSIGKRYLRENPPANPEKGYSLPERENLKQAFNNFNSQWTQNFNKGNPIAINEALLDGKATVVEDVGPKRPPLNITGGKEGFIQAFMEGGIDNVDYVGELGLPPETARGIAEDMWNALSQEERAQWLGGEAPGMDADGTGAVATTDGVAAGGVAAGGVATGGTSFTPGISVPTADLYQTIEGIYNFAPGLVESMANNGQLPPVPTALLNALTRPFIQVTEMQATYDERGDLIEVPSTRMVENPAIRVLMDAYTRQLESQVQVFRDVAQRKYQTEQGALQRQNDIDRAILSATGGNVAAGDYSPEDVQAYQDFQREMARISGGVGFGGTTGDVPYSQQVQSALFPRMFDATKTVTTPRGLTATEQQMADLYPTEVQAQLEEAQRELNRQQFLEDLALRQRNQQLAELQAQEQIRQIDEQNRQAQTRTIADQMLGLQQIGTSRGDIEQNRRLELARLLSDPTALATMSALYGSGALPTSGDVFAQPFGAPQSTGVPSAQTGGVPNFSTQVGEVGGVDGKTAWVQNRAFELMNSGAMPDENSAAIAAENEWIGLGPQLQQQYMQTPPTPILDQPVTADVSIGDRIDRFIPFNSPLTTMTQPQFQDLSRYAQDVYTAKRALTGVAPEEQAKRRRDISPGGTTFAAPRMPVGINRYMTGEYNTL
tara:strand:- start:13772 stop:16528 length:2757 start_codon:yes stop_codon:yes gene_type:complete